VRVLAQIRTGFMGQAIGELMLIGHWPAPFDWRDSEGDTQIVGLARVELPEGV
jgi:hypothetical protein